jgi:2-hydroxymethylglutarate dehydrogenase
MKTRTEVTAKGGFLKPVIGFIGLGAMGAPMAQNLLKAGYPLVVYDMREKAMEDLTQAGARKGSSIKDIAGQSSIVITMLPSSTEVEAVVLGKDGVIDNARSVKMVIDMSSSFPTSTKMVCERLNAKGIKMVDAPVSGGAKGAREVTLTIMVGGEEADYKECLPILQAMGKNIYYVGKIGSGHAVKALNNLCSAGTMAITSEAMVVATKMGLDPDKVIEIINVSSGRSWSSQYKFPTFVLNDAFNSGFTIGLLNKDIEMATRLGREQHIPMYVSAIVQQIYNYAVGKGAGKDCHASIIKFMEEWADVKVRSKKKN